MTTSQEEFQRRVDEAHRRVLASEPQTVPLLKTPLPTELSKVPETPPPDWGNPYYPFKTSDEYIEALKRENDVLVAEIENKKIRGGVVPFWYHWKKMLAGGIGALLIGYFSRGCV